MQNTVRCSAHGLVEVASAEVTGATHGRASQRRSHWGWAQRLASALIVTAFVYFVWSRRADLLGVLEISFVVLVTLIALTLLTWTVNALQNWLMYRVAGVQCGLGEMWRLTAASVFGNYLPMRMGTVLRARYLKSQHGLRYAQFGAVFGIRSVLMVFSTALLGLAGTLGVALEGGRLGVELLLVFGGMLILTAVSWVVSVPSRWLESGGGRAVRILNDLMRALGALRSHSSVSLRVLLLLLCQQLLTAARFAVVAGTVGQVVSPSTVVLMAALASFTSYLALTPGGVGIREAIMAYAAFATGAELTVGAYVGAVDRGVIAGMAVLVGGGCFGGLWWSLRRTERVQGPTPLS